MFNLSFLFSSFTGETKGDKINLKIQRISLFYSENKYLSRIHMILPMEGRKRAIRKISSHVCVTMKLKKTQCFPGVDGIFHLLNPTTPILKMYRSKETIFKHFFYNTADVSTCSEFIF